MWPEPGQPSVGGARDHAHNKAELHEEPEHIVQAIIDKRHAWAAAGHPVPPAVEKALMVLKEAVVDCQTRTGIAVLERPAREGHVERCKV